MKHLFEHLDTLVFTTSEDHVDENFYYATGVSKAKHASAVFVANVKNSMVITNELEHGLFPGKKIIAKDRDDFERILRANTGKRIGMNFSAVNANTLDRYKSILKGKKIVDVSKQMGDVRAIKTNAEIAKIKEACRMTEDIFGDIEKLLKKSATEKDLALELKYAAMKNGAEDVSYPPIVASGRNAALPHHSPTSARLGKGVLLIDFGVLYDGYCSDLTRTFYVGKADDKAENIYSIVYKAQRAGINHMKPGKKARDAHIAAEKIIRHGLKQNILHAFGHGLGIQVHDYPGAVGAESDFILAKNMVITAEPGYYSSVWGGVRIEDDVVIGKGALTFAPKVLLSV